MGTRMVTMINPITQFILDSREFSLLSTVALNSVNAPSNLATPALTSLKSFLSPASSFLRPRMSVSTSCNLRSRLEVLRCSLSSVVALLSSGTGGWFDSRLPIQHGKIRRGEISEHPSYDEHLEALSHQENMKGAIREIRGSWMP